MFNSLQYRPSYISVRDPSLIYTLSLNILNRQQRNLLILFHLLDLKRGIRTESRRLSLEKKIHAQMTIFHLSRIIISESIFVLIPRHNKRVFNRHVI
jgi:hypothetical protein